MSKKTVSAPDKRRYVPPRRYRKPGRPFKHGAYSLAIQDDLLKKNPRVTKYLMDTRAGLVKDVAGSEDDLTEQQRLMIDRIISKLAVCRLIELYIEKYGAFRRDQLQRRTVLELEPCLGVNYLAFSNSIDRALVALGLTKKQAEQVLDPLALARVIDAEKAAQGAGEGQRQSKEPASQEIVPPSAPSAAEGPGAMAAQDVREQGK